MLLDTTESTSELGWTTYPDTGVRLEREREDGVREEGVRE